MVCVAVLIGDGVHGDQAPWPTDIAIHHFKAPRDAARLIAKAKSGAFSLVVTHAKSVRGDMCKQIRDAVPCKVVNWPFSPSQLASKLHTLIPCDDAPVPPPSLRIVAAPVGPATRPFVRVAEASRQPARRPSWTEDEQEALRLAHEDAIDVPKFLDGYLALTADLDVPVRSRAEIKAELERLRQHDPRHSSDSIDVVWTLFSAINAIRLTGSVVKACKQAMLRQALMVSEMGERIDVIHRQSIDLVQLYRDASHSFDVLT